MSDAASSSARRAELDRLAKDHGYPSRNAVVRAWLEASRARRNRKRQ